MRPHNLSQDETYIKKHRFLKHWPKVLMLLCAAAVFCTTYALARPAIAMERTCQIPEHTHIDACYTQLVVDGTQTEDVSADPDALTCTNTDESHVHTARCYGTWVLACGLEEHTHTDACYTSVSTAAPEDTSDAVAGALNVSLLYGDQQPQSSHPDGVSYYTHTTICPAISSWSPAGRRQT